MMWIRTTCLVLVVQAFLGSVTAEKVRKDPRPICVNLTLLYKGKSIDESKICANLAFLYKGKEYMKVQYLT